MGINEIGDFKRGLYSFAKESFLISLGKRHRDRNFYLSERDGHSPQWA